MGGVSVFFFLYANTLRPTPPFPTLVAWLPTHVYASTSAPLASAPFNPSPALAGPATDAAAQNANVYHTQLRAP